MNYTVYWGQLRDEDFAYGSRIKVHHPGWIDFQNGQIPSGKLIHQWNTQTDFTFDRENPALPYLIPGTRYYVNINMKMDPADSLYFVLNFYQFGGEKIEEVHLTNTKPDFVYPDGAMYYDIQLLNAGNKSFSFYNLEIYTRKMLNTSEINLVPINSHSIQKTSLNIIIMEPNKNGYYEIPDDFKNENRATYRLYTPDYMGIDFFEDSMVSNTQNKLNELLNKHGLLPLRFIGCGYYSNIVAKYLHQLYPESILLLARSYEAGLKNWQGIDLTKWIDSNLNSDHVHYYGPETEVEEKLSLVAPQINPMNTLKESPMPREMIHYR